MITINNIFWWSTNLYKIECLGIGETCVCDFDLRKQNSNKTNVSIQ